MFRINNTQYFHFLQQADALRRSGSLCDAIISVKSHTFRAHRLVLACASRRLAQQLAQADTDSPAHFTLEYFSPRTFQQVLDFTYTQAVEVSLEDLYLLLRAAQLLEMRPLEDQCRKQLDTLDHRARKEEEERGETKDVKEEKESAKDMAVKRKGSPVQEEKRREPSSTAEKTSNSVVTENHSPPESAENHSRSPSTRKKPRLSPLSSAPHNSVITSSPPSSSPSSSSSPWAFSANMWNSVSTLRKIAENYSNFFGAQSPNQSSVAYPFSLSAPHMFPLLSPHFQNRVHHSVMGHSGLYPHCAQNLYTGSTGMGSIIKQGLLKTKKSSQRAFHGAVQRVEQSFPQVPKDRAERVTECRECKTRRLGDPAQQESASSATGEACVGCHFCGRGGVVQREPPSNHLERQSTSGDKPYQCKHCPKKFSLKHQLDTHHRVHTGEKPFECRLCGQRSRDYSAMIKHLRTHGGAAPYQCTVCLEFCSSLVAMHRHVKSHAVQDFPPDWNINSTYLYTSHI